MFTELKKINRKPEIFSIHTTEKLWTTPHLAAQMLKTHLNQDTSLASRPVTAIDRVVTWLDETFNLDGKAVCDLGCGPGLYAERYARRGAVVHGLDFSSSSIEHARQSALENSVPVTYDVRDYLADPLPTNQDLMTLIYCDLCPLSHFQRQTLLGKIRKSLTPNGAFVFDVASIKAFDAFAEHSTFGRNYMGGFWSADEYFAFHHGYRYEADKVSLDHFTIVEKNGAWDIYNWMQYFTAESIGAELAENGFEIVDLVDSFGAAGENETSFGVIAKPQS